MTMKAVWLFGVLLLSFQIQAKDIAYPNINIKNMNGFAKEFNTTGGENGQRVVVTDLPSLIREAGDTQSKIIIINGEISSPTKVRVTLGRNKTIVGAFGGKNILNNIHLITSDQSANIILENLVFKHSPNIKGNDDIQVYIRSGKQYWIDHCSFVGHEWSDNDGSLDKLIYVGALADGITISNSLFSNHRYGAIFGYPSDEYDEHYNGYPRMTISNNVYRNIEVRSPGLMRYGYYHVYNNLIQQYHLGYTLAQSAKVLSENNVFEMGNEKGLVDDKKNNTSFTDIGSYPTSIQRFSKPQSWKVSYDYHLMSVDVAKTWDEKYAGAQVNNNNFKYPK